jgi:hypothetical protein
MGPDERGIGWATGFFDIIANDIISKKPVAHPISLS